MNDTKKSFLNLLKAESEMIGADDASVRLYLEKEGYDYDAIRRSGEELAAKLLLRAQASVAGRGLEPP